MSAHVPTLRVVLTVGPQGSAELLACDDSQQLCWLLLTSPWGWRSSTQHTEAVELLARVHGTSEVPDWFVALLLCTCWRWHRVTTKLIAALDRSGLLDDDALDRLAASLLSHAQEVVYPLTWFSAQWREVDLTDGNTRTYTVTEDAVATHRSSVQPPLRRWAANRALRDDPTRLGELLAGAERLEARHRDALVHGLLDAARALNAPDRRTLAERALRCGQPSVRLTALDCLCDLDGPETARQRADADTSETVRSWRPAAEIVQPSLL